MSDKLVRIKNRYDSAINWSTENPVLAAGEIGIDSTNNIIKVGNGTDCWFNLRSVNKENIFFPYVIESIDMNSSNICIKVPGYFYTSINNENPEETGPAKIDYTSLKFALFIQGCLPVIGKCNGNNYNIYSATDSNEESITTVKAWFNINISNFGSMDKLCAELDINIDTIYNEELSKPYSPLEGRSAVLFICDNSEFIM